MTPGFTAVFPLALLLLSSTSSSTILPVVLATTQVIENLSFGSAKTYTIAATDTLFKLNNVDITGTTSDNLNIDFPATTQPGLVIDIQNCDVSGDLVFGKNSLTPTSLSEADVLIKGNTMQKLLAFTAAAAGAFSVTLDANTVVNVEDNTATDVSMFISSGASDVTFTISAGSSVNMFDNSVSNSLSFATSFGAGSTTMGTITTGSSVNIYSNTITGNGQVLKSTTDSASSMIISSSASLRFYSNSFTTASSWLDFVKTDGTLGTTNSVTLSEQSTIEVYGNTFTSSFVSIFVASYGFLTVAADSSCSTSIRENTMQSLGVFRTSNGGSLSYTATQASRLTVSGNTMVTALRFARIDGASSSLALSLTRSMIDIESNSVGSEMQVLHSSDSGVTAGLTLATSSVIYVRGNTVSALISSFAAETGSSLMLAMSSASSVQIYENTVSTGDISALMAKNAGTTLSAALSTSCQFAVTKNTLTSGSLYLGYAEDSGDVAVTAAVASVINHLWNSVDTSSSQEVLFGKILTGGTFASDFLTASRLKSSEF